MMVALVVVPHHDPDGDRRHEADDEGGGGDEGRPRQPRRRRGRGPMTQAGVLTSRAAAVGNFRRGTELFVEQPVAGVATRGDGCGGGGGGCGGGGGVHSPRIRIARSPIGDDAAVEVGGAPVAVLAVLCRVGLPLLFRHCANLVIRPDSARYSRRLIERRFRRYLNIVERSACVRAIAIAAGAGVQFIV